jgi:hypothetical protein
MINTEIQNTLRNVRFNAFSACSGVQLLRIPARTLATLTLTPGPSRGARPRRQSRTTNGRPTRDNRVRGGSSTNQLRGSIAFVAMHCISPSRSLRRMQG